MEYSQIQEKVIGIFEKILKDKGRKSWEVKVHPNEGLQNQDFDSLETMDAFLKIEDFFARKYGLFLDVSDLEFQDYIRRTIKNNYSVGLTPKNIVDYVADKFPMTKRGNQISSHKTLKD